MGKKKEIQMKSNHRQIDMKGLKLLTKLWHQKLRAKVLFVGGENPENLAIGQIIEFPVINVIYESVDSMKNGIAVSRHMTEALFVAVDSIELVSKKI